MRGYKTLYITAYLGFLTESSGMEGKQAVACYWLSPALLLPSPYVQRKYREAKVVASELPKHKYGTDKRVSYVHPEVMCQYPYVCLISRLCCALTCCEELDPRERIHSLGASAGKRAEYLEVEGVRKRKRALSHVCLVSLRFTTSVFFLFNDASKGIMPRALITTRLGCTPSFVITGSQIG